MISPEGFRIDGRRPNEPRRVKCEMGLFERADGSSYFEQGNTRVLCAVYGPREVRLYLSPNYIILFTTFYRI